MYFNLKSRKFMLVACIFFVGCNQTRANTLFSTECCQEERKVVWSKLKLDEFLNTQKAITGNPIIQVGVLQCDLNDDGRKDFLAQIYDTAHCGTAGCSTHIFMQDENGDYYEITGPSNTHSEIEIFPTTSNGMHDLVFQGGKGEECVWKWNKTEYELSLCK